MKNKKIKSIYVPVVKDNFGFYNTEGGCTKKLPCNMVFMGNVELSKEYKFDEDCDNKVIVAPGDEVINGFDGYGIEVFYAGKFKDINTGIYYYVLRGLDQYIELCKECCPVYYDEGGIGEGNLTTYIAHLSYRSIGTSEDTIQFKQGEAFGGYVEGDVAFLIEAAYTPLIIHTGTDEIRIFENDVDTTDEWTLGINGYTKLFPIGTPVPDIEVRIINNYFDFTIDTPAGNTDYGFYAPMSGKIDYGLGDGYEYFENVTLLSKVYPEGIYNVSIVVFDNLIGIDIDNINMTEFDCKLPVGFQTIDLSFNKLTQFNPTVPLVSTLKNITLSQNQITDFDPSIALPAGLEEIYLSSNLIQNFDPSIALPAGLKTLHLAANPTTTFNPTIALPAGLEYLLLSGGNLPVFNPTLPLPAGLKQLSVYSCHLVTFEPVVSLPLTLIALGLPDSDMVDTDIDSLLAYLDAIPFSNPGPKDLFINPGPSVAGLASQASLEAKGWVFNIS